MFTSRAPGEPSSLLQRNMREIAPDNRHDNAKVYAMVSKVYRDGLETQTMVRDMWKRQEGAGGQDLSVSVTCTPSAAG